MNFTSIAQIEAAETKDLIAFYNDRNADKPVKKFTNRETALRRCIALLAPAEAAPEAKEVEAESPAVETQEQTEADASFVWPFAKLGEAKPENAAPVVDTKPSLSKPKAAMLRKIALSDYTTLNGAEPSTLADIGFVWANTTIENSKQHQAFKDLVIAGLAINEGSGEDAVVSLTQAGFDAYKALPEGYGVAADIEKKPISGASNAAGVAASWTLADVAAARLKRDSVSVTVNGATTSHESVHAAFSHYRLMQSKHIRFRGILKIERTAVYQENGVDYTFAIL